MRKNENKDKLIELYNNGVEVEEILKICGCGSTFFYTTLRQNKDTIKKRVKFTEEDINNIVNLYVNENIPASHIAKTYKTTNTTIRKILVSKNLEIRNLSDEFKKKILKFKDQIIKEYEIDKIPIVTLAKKYKIGKRNIMNCFKDWGIITRPKSYYCYNNYEKLKRDFFTNIDTEEKAYWLGFLIADGSLINKNTISLMLQAGDYNHIVKFKEAIGSDNVIQYCKRDNEYRINISDPQFKTDLNKYGIIHNKCFFTYLPQIEDKFMRDLIRGLNDGDGMVKIYNKKRKCKNGEITIYKNPFFKLTGTFSLVNSVLDYLIKKTGIITKTKPYKQFNSFNICLNANIAVKVINFLYKDATVYLDRKMLVAQEIINNYS